MKVRDCLDKLYLYVSNVENFLMRKALRYIVRTIARFYWRFICMFPIPEINEQAKVIISLTTFPARINNIYMVCHSLLRQSIKPEKVILWLSKEQFKGIDDLPKCLLSLLKYGLEIRFVDGDLRSHKKYYYVLQEFPEMPIILADDDIIYNSRLVETLILESKRFPNSIIAQYARKIEKCENSGELKSYTLWNKTYIPHDFNMIFFGSGGGTLIPPHSLYEDVLRMDLFLKLTPTADDIWLNAMARKKGTLIYKSKLNSALITLPSKNNMTLSAINNKQGNFINNDAQIKRVNNYYKIRIF